MRRALLALVLLGGSSLLAQAPSDCLERTIPIEIGVRANRRADMSKLRYVATVGGKPVEIVSATLASGPQRVVLVLDTSASMGPLRGGSVNKSPIEFAFELGADAAKKLPASASMALILFGKQEDRVEFAQSREVLLRKLEQKRPAVVELARGKTPLFDAIRDAVSLMPSPQPGDAVYVITDGGDNRSKVEAEQVLQLVQGRGIRVFVFLLTRGYSSVEETKGQTQLRRLAERSGGATTTFQGRPDLTGNAVGDASDFAIDKGTAPALDAALATIYQAIAKPTLLRIRLPRAPARFQHWNLEVVDEQGRVQKNMSLSYPRELAPCARP